MKATVLFALIAALTTLTSARPTFDKIAEVLLDVFDDKPYSRYPPGSANYQQGYHQHHHDHYYGNGVQPGGYYQQPHGHYPGTQPTYYPPQGPYVQGPSYAQAPYPQRPYVQEPYAQGNYGDYANPTSGFSITAEYQPSGYARHHSYKQNGY